jgi:transcription termination/antitermination protein NusG
VGRSQLPKWQGGAAKVLSQSNTEINLNTALPSSAECRLAGKTMVETKSNLQCNQPSHWYAVQTRPHHEKRVEERLRMNSLQTFLPIHRCRHLWKNGVHAELELPLFPCYLFARASIYDRVNLLRIPGVLGLASSSAHPSQIAAEDIEALRAAVESLQATPHPYLNVGDRVRIISGPLAGMQGILLRRKRELRVVLSIEIIMRSITVIVSEFEIEKT